MEALKKRRKEPDLEFAIVGKKCAQQINLVPRPLAVDELPRILKWVVDIVNMDKDAGREKRQDLKEDEVDFAAGSGNVRRIDEQDVSGAEIAETRAINILQAVRQESDSCMVSRFQKALEARGFRIDEGAVDGRMEEQLIGIEQNGGRETASDFDNTARLEMAQEAVIKDGVGVTEKAIVEIVAAISGPLLRKRLLRVECGQVVDQLQLVALMQVNTGKSIDGLAAPNIGFPGADVFNVRNGGIVMTGRRERPQAKICLKTVPDIRQGGCGPNGE